MLRGPPGHPLAHHLGDGHRGECRDGDRPSPESGEGHGARCTDSTGRHRTGTQSKTQSPQWGPRGELLTQIQILRDDVTTANDYLGEALQGLEGVPATLAATELDPTAKRAKPRLAAQTPQMLWRPLAYNPN